ncbi:MAG: Gfo/Idh/MocA family oxidoreductase [Clostridia bacterium]|nr:Gfo/Idh/MocA family oxidoreductase [Clostridia bacterium]
MLKVGIIGTGAMGTQHFRRMVTLMSNVEVVAVSDVNEANATSLIKSFPGIRFIADAHALIRDPEVQAILIASSSPTHEDYCLTAIEEQKPVFCEKPLSVTSEGAKKVVEAEMKGGKRLIQLGFNRRFDSGFMQLHDILASGKLGDALLAHCSHRAPRVPDWYSTTMAITETLVHEIDIMSWIFNDYFISAQVVMPRKHPDASAILQDPQVILLTTSRGALVMVDVFVNCQYGYDIQCDIVAEKGTARLPDLAKIVVRHDASCGFEIGSDGLKHFEESYNREIQCWIDAAITGEIKSGPSSWDGYKVAVVTDSAVKAQTSGAIEPIAALETPAFYRS